MTEVVNTRLAEGLQKFKSTLERSLRGPGTWRIFDYKLKNANAFWDIQELESDFIEKWHHHWRKQEYQNFITALEYAEEFYRQVSKAYIIEYAKANYE